MADRTGGGGDRPFTKTFETEGGLNPNAVAELRARFGELTENGKYAFRKFEEMSDMPFFTVENLIRFEGEIEMRLGSAAENKKFRRGEVVKFCREILQIETAANTDIRASRLDGIGNRIGRERRHAFGTLVGILRGFLERETQKTQQK